MKFELVDIEFPAILSHVSIARQPLSQAPHLMQEASKDPDAANMFMRMFYLFQGTKQDDFSLLMQEKALKLRQVYKILLPNQNSRPKRIKLLALFAPGDMRENLPIDYLLERWTLISLFFICYPISHYLKPSPIMRWRSLQWANHPTIEHCWNH